ncbi:MAG: hypothetical protein V1862_12005 [Methanobacteriota archaeon]
MGDIGYRYQPDTRITRLGMREVRHLAPDISGDDGGRLIGARPANQLVIAPSFPGGMPPGVPSGLISPFRESVHGTQRCTPCGIGDRDTAGTAWYMVSGWSIPTGDQIKSAISPYVHSL